MLTPLAERLLALQELDAEADRLGVRRERLPERAELTARTEALAGWEQQRSAMRKRIEDLGVAMERAEEQTAALRADKQRFEAQLKTVIAPREAEALMHEIATVDERIDEIETQELDDLGESSSTEEALQDHLREEGSLRAALEEADGALAAAVAGIDAELAALEAPREELRAAIDESTLAAYDRLRAQEGIAVARLVGHRCDGCHLDLSAAEVDTAKDEAAGTGYTDCPQCGRMLVV